MAEDYKEKLQNLLRKLFQFDSVDLDFGIYRIMNQKRDQIERFIKNDLVDAVEAGFGEYSESKGANLKDEIEAIKAEIHENLGEDALDDSGGINQIYVTTPFAKKLAGRYDKARAAMKDADMSDQQEAEIFSHIYQFFSRYYDNGDFMSLRRYSQKEKYAIPYNGEEVVLHWVNKDQYYIKTGENFKNYSFKVGEYSVEFRILEAEGTTNNNKAGSRFFVLALNEPGYDAGNKQLTIFFEYRGLNKDEEKEYGTKNVQDGIIGAMKDFIPLQDAGLKGALNRIVDVVTRRTVLGKHLRAYTKKNTTDYFIHKDLKGFLTRELDFYIKNEVFHLDDLGTEHEVGVEQYVSRVRVMKSVCLKVIDFLAQIEDFQKMLFEKKKFVVNTDYCITLDYIDEKYYPDILKSNEQLEEWKKLYSFDIGEEINKLKGKLIGQGKSDEYKKYEILREQPTLIIDTKFYNINFKLQILNEIDDLDEKINGILINSDNSQALDLLQYKFYEQIKFCYIDPPYNTGSDDFIYKDRFQHSSWISMIYNRLEIAKRTLSSDGVIFISIGQDEIHNLIPVCNNIFEENNKIGICSRVMKTGSNKGKFFSPNVEYVLVYCKSIENVNEFRESISDELISKVYTQIEKEGLRKGEKFRTMGLYQSSLEARPNQRYWIRCPDNSFVIPPGETFPHLIEDNSKITPQKGDGVWRWSCERYRQELVNNNIVFLKTKTSSLLNEKKEPAIWNIYTKIWLNDRLEEGRVPIDLISKFENRHSSVELTNLGLPFDYAKPTGLIKYLFEITNNTNNILSLDFFAGSGTTGHAILKNNKEKDCNNKFILIEMGKYFDNVLKPRILKVIYTDNWKNGVPQDSDGSKKQIIKYQSLEQYEDTLNNIEFTESGTVQRTLADMDGYFLRYMLDFETRDSPCRFNVVKLDHPFSYTLKITEGNELKEQTVDLVETFNYLLGLYIRKIRTFTNNGTYYRVVLGTKDEDDIVVIWRDTENLDLKEDKTFIEGTILNEFNPEKTYINSDFYVEGAHPIEPEFKKLMVG